MYSDKTQRAILSQEGKKLIRKMVKGYKQAEPRRRNKLAVMKNTSEDKEILLFSPIRKGQEVWTRYSRARAWRSMTQHPVLRGPQGPLDNAHWSDTVTLPRTPGLGRRTRGMGAGEQDVGGRVG